jgi:hypothetical protein
MLIVRLNRDDEYIEKLQDRVIKFLDEVNSAVTGLKEKMK